MIDYYPTIRRAVDALSKNTGEARRAIYERARGAVVARLRASEPALSESAITKERLALEEGIRKVESEEARRTVSKKPKTSPADPLAELARLINQSNSHVPEYKRNRQGKPSAAVHVPPLLSTEELARRRATEEETRRFMAAQALSRAEFDEKRRLADEEARRKAEQELEEEARLAEEYRRIEEEARLRAEEEERRRLAEEEVRRKAEENRRLEEERRLKAEEEERRRAQEEEDQLRESDTREGERPESTESEGTKPRPSHTPPPVETIPNPQGRAIQFAVSSEGPIDLAPLSTPGEHFDGRPDQVEDYSELRAKATRLIGLGSNRLGRASMAVESFLALPEEIRQVRLKLFWSRINTLRIILEDHEDAISTQNRTGDPDERKLESTVASALKDLVKNINLFVFADKDLTDCDFNSVSPQDSQTAREEASIAGPIISDVIASSGIATESAREVLHEQIQNLKLESTSLLGRNSIEFGRRSIQNFIGELLRRAYAPLQSLSRSVKNESGSAWQKVREGAYQAVGAGIVAAASAELAGVTHFTSSFIRFVSTHSDTLTAYVMKAFHNPALVEVIRWIEWLGS